MPYNPSVRGRRQWLREGRRHWRRLWLALAAMAGLVALGGFVWLWWKGVPTLYQNSGAGSDARAEAVTGTRTALMVGLAGVGAVGALWLNNRTYRLTQQGQITDRYTKAVEQLGGDKLDVRLGGIYALERIAVDSKRDHQIIVAVLSAFVRERTDPVRTDKAIVDEGLRHPLGEAYQSQTHKSAARKSEPQPAVDVQAAVTVLSRLPRRRGVGRGELGGVRLAGTRLDWADLATARLGWANLSGAQLQWAKLSGADLISGGRTSPTSSFRGRTCPAQISRRRTSSMLGSWGRTCPEPISRRRTCPAPRCTRRSYSAPSFKRHSYMGLSSWGKRTYSVPRYRMRSYLGSGLRRRTCPARN
jgi:pentapeptide repeat protein